MYRTKNGYDTYEVISAFQKSIRRGLEEDALYWGFELMESDYSHLAFKRLKVTIHEDIGTGNMLASLFALKSLEDCMEWYPNTRSWKLAFTNAIISLCRSSKSRDADYYQALILYEKKTKRKQIPDWALDKHTRKGKKMGRRTDHFIKEGCKLEPKDFTTDGLKERAKIAWEWEEKTGNKLFDKKEEDTSSKNDTNWFKTGE